LINPIHVSLFAAESCARLYTQLHRCLGGEMWRRVCFSTLKPINSFCQAKGGADKGSAVYESAMGLASKAVESDEPLLHPPSHVALACVLAAADAQGVGKEWQQYVWQRVAACAALVDGIDAAIDGGVLATLRFLLWNYGQVHARLTALG
jgi:hypothetical protein